jgi:pimeloyl-ACP methyl ester carboxylesterase
MVIELAALVGACAGSDGRPSPGATLTAATPTASAPAADAGASTTGKVSVGAYSLFYSCAGVGSPTVFLEHGLGGDVRQWTDVFREVSKRTRVCDYSRVNAYLSDAVTGMHTVKDSVADAHALLAKAGIAGPYVLVGFSWGGLISQAYASAYPSEVAGLVLVEANNANEISTYWAHMTPAQVAQDKVETGGPNPEQVDILRSFDEVRAGLHVPDVPLVVLSHTQSDPEEWPAGWDPATFDALQAGLQADLVKLTSHGTQILIDGGHDIPDEHPEAVIAAIDQVLKAIATP